MPDCGVHYLWFAFVCFLIRSHPPHPRPQAYHFALQSPDGSLLRIAAHPGFGPVAQIAFPAPWLPMTPAPVQYTFVVFVRDAAGLESGPFAAPRHVTAQAPSACRPSCATGALLVEYVACLMCSGQVGVSAVNQVCPPPPPPPSVLHQHPLGRVEGGALGKNVIGVVRRAEGWSLSGSFIGSVDGGRGAEKAEASPTAPCATSRVGFRS